MNDDADPIRRLLDLAQWYLEGMRRHAAELFGRTTGLLTGRRTDLAYPEVRLCARLDGTLFVLALEVNNLLIELRDGLSPSPPHAEEVARLRAEYERIVDAWHVQMQGVKHVWQDRKPPQ